jgi:hypothetical protein
MMAAGDDRTGIQALSLAADQARLILQGQATQIRLRPAAMADRIEPGTLVWLREPFAFAQEADRFAPTVWIAGSQWPKSSLVHFLADGPKPAEFGITRFARTLPRELSRAFIRVDAVETAPVQRWTAQDEAALGMSREEFISSWSQAARAVATFGGDPAGLRWADNPRVRIITFRLVRQNIDAWLGCQRGAAAQSKLAAAVPETTAASSAHADRPVCSATPSATPSGHERT